MHFPLFGMHDVVVGIAVNFFLRQLNKPIIRLWNTITVVVDGYMLIGALSMDVEVPDIEESVTILEQILNFFKKIIEWFRNLF